MQNAKQRIVGTSCLHRRTRATVAIFVLLSTFACEGGATEEDDFDGVPVVRSNAVGIWREDQKWRLSPTSRIGSADGDDAYTFGWVVGHALDDLGRVWVADGLQQNVRVFDERGAHVRTVGRKGRGPGEFRSIAGLAFASDGNLWVQDSGNARFAVYDTTGALVDTHQRDANSSVAPWPGGFDDRGRLYDVARLPAASGQLTPAVVRFDAALQPIDTFTLPTFEQEHVSVEKSEGANRTIDRVTLPFAATQVWAVDPKGQIWVAKTDRYRFARYAFDGTAEQVVEREHTPIQINARDRERMLELYRQASKAGDGIDPSRIPRTMPALNSFFFDDQGHLWVMPAHPHGQISPLDVFKPTGEYLGRIRPPTNLLSGPTPVVRGDRVVGVTSDADGVPSVVVMKLEKPKA